MQSLEGQEKIMSYNLFAKQRFLLFAVNCFSNNSGFSSTNVYKTSTQISLQYNSHLIHYNGAKLLFLCSWYTFWRKVFKFIILITIENIHLLFRLLLVFAICLSSFKGFGSICILLKKHLVI